MLNVIFSLVCVLIFTACGMAPPACKTAANADGSCPAAVASTKETTAAPAEPTAKKKDTTTPTGDLQGYVVSAFDVTVNGQQYADSEDFYTKEMASLTDQVADAGYPGYTMQFDAQIGLDDLKYGMNVYVAAVGNSGFAGETKVNKSGRFAISIPEDSQDVTFRIRTNKRVSIILTNPDNKKDKVNFCYNFSSANTEATIHAPALVSTFQTTLTAYACSNVQSGMQIPQKAEAPKAVPAKAKAPAAAPKVVTPAAAISAGTSTPVAAISAGTSAAPVAAISAGTTSASVN